MWVKVLPFTDFYYRDYYYKKQNSNHYKFSFMVHNVEQPYCMLSKFIFSSYAFVAYCTSAVIVGNYSYSSYAVLFIQRITISSDINFPIIL